MFTVTMFQMMLVAQSQNMTRGKGPSSVNKVRSRGVERNKYSNETQKHKILLQYLEFKRATHNQHVKPVTQTIIH